MGLGFLLTVGLVIWLIAILSLWQVFEKAGEAGWKSIVPIYNTYVLSKIGGQPIWVFLILFLPFVGIIGSLLIALGVAKAFGKEAWFGFILFFFGFFGYLYLGWGESEYVGVEQTSDEQ